MMIQSLSHTAERHCSALGHLAYAAEGLLLWQLVFLHLSKCRGLSKWKAAEHTMT